MTKFCVFRLQLEFGVAVDYTASNGAVHDPSSLHFVGYGTPNQYEMAIQAVLEICEHYNKTRVYDAVGFGAQIPPGMFVNHLFPLVSLLAFCLRSMFQLSTSRTWKRCSEKSTTSR